MALSDKRIVSAGETPYPHEREGIKFATDSLPDTDPYHAWALVDLLDPSTGRLHEIDLLVLGYAQLYLVELKAHPGTMRGDEVDWRWRTPEGRDIYLENPRRLTRRKAQILASRLARAMPGTRPPWVEPLVFLSSDNIRLALEPEGRIGVVTRDDFARAITHGDYPGADPRRSQQRIDRPTMRATVQALKDIGFRARKGKLHVGQYQLGELLDETDAYQDREASHRDIQSQKRRARTYLVPEQTSVERRQQLLRAANREAQLLYEVREHPGVLTYTDFISDAPLGPTVLLDLFDGGVPLDAYLRQNPALSLEQRVGIIAQVGRALDHCHKKEVVHGALSPAAVLVRPGRDDTVDVRLFNFQLGHGGAVSATSHWTDLAEHRWALYQAPELREDGGAPTPQSDVFSLGALAYFVLTGRDPAADIVELTRTMRERRCLDPRVVDEQVPEKIASVVIFATDQVLAARADHAGQWIELLLEQAREDDREPERDTSPLVANKDDFVGPYLVEGVLGHGASARVLQVTADDNRSYALKCSLGPEHDTRLQAEAEVLGRLNDSRIVSLVEQRTLAERTCLLLTLAGNRTLHRELRDHGSVSLDYASRWGEDLLDALKHLEELDLTHRDIKPANLGVGSVGKKRLALRLFDFSLAGAGATEIRVGTAAYRDPYLAERGSWDAAADRFSAAVTLHEILTGKRPALSATAPIEIAAELFDASVRATLTAFFARAFAPRAGDRHASAAEMRNDWSACFDARVHAAEAAPAEAELTDADIAAIPGDTPIAALPLSTRARNALDRAGLLVASDLLSLPDNRLSGIRGVGRLVARDIHDFRTRWQALHRAEAARGAAFFAQYHGDDLMVTVALPRAAAQTLGDAGLHSLAQVAAAPAAQIEALARRHGLDAAAVAAVLEAENRSSNERDRPTTLEGWVAALYPSKRKRDQQVRALMGLEGPLTGRIDAAPRALAEALGLTAATVYNHLGKAAERWQAHPALADLRARLAGFLDDRGGAAPLADAADWLAADTPHDPNAAPGALRVQAAAVLRALCEVDKAEPAGMRYVRVAERPWLVAQAELTADLRTLGRAADGLARREVPAGLSETEHALRAALDSSSPLFSLATPRLVRLAADASEHAAASSRLELYPRGMTSRRALELSSQALGTGLEPDELRRRVAARYPAAEALPARPELDELVESIASLTFLPERNAYQRKGEQLGASAHTSFASYTRVSQLSPHSIDERTVEIEDTDDRIRAAVERRALLVVGVSFDHAEIAARILTRRFGLGRASFDRAFLAALDGAMAALDIEPAVVIETDATGPAADAWGNLTSLAAEAAAEVAASLFPPRAPLLLTEPGLIARYQLTDFLAALVAASCDDAAEAIVLLCPGVGRGTPTIEGRIAIPGLVPGQSLWLPPSWLSEYQRAA